MESIIPGGGHGGGNEHTQHTHDDDGDGDDTDCSFSFSEDDESVLASLSHDGGEVRGTANAATALHVDSAVAAPSEADAATASALADLGSPRDELLDDDDGPPSSFGSFVPAQSASDLLGPPSEPPPAPSSSAVGGGSGQLSSSDFVLDPNYGAGTAALPTQERTRTIIPPRSATPPPPRSPQRPSSSGGRKGGLHRRTVSAGEGPGFKGGGGGIISGGAAFSSSSTTSNSTPHRSATPPPRSPHRPGSSGVRKGGLHRRTVSAGHAEPLPGASAPAPAAGGSAGRVRVRARSPSTVSHKSSALSGAAAGAAAAATTETASVGSASSGGGSRGSPPRMKQQRRVLPPSRSVPQALSSSGAAGGDGYGLQIASQQPRQQQRRRSSSVHSSDYGGDAGAMLEELTGDGSSVGGGGGGGGLANGYGPMPIVAQQQQRQRSSSHHSADYGGDANAMLQELTGGGNGAGSGNVDGGVPPTAQHLQDLVAFPVRKRSTSLHSGEGGMEGLLDELDRLDAQEEERERERRTEARGGNRRRLGSNDSMSRQRPRRQQPPGHQGSAMAGLSTASTGGDGSVLSVAAALSVHSSGGEAASVRSSVGGVDGGHHHHQHHHPSGAAVLPAPPRPAEVTARERLVERERQARLERERARLKRQIALNREQEELEEARVGGGFGHATMMMSEGGHPDVRGDDGYGAEEDDSDARKDGSVAGTVGDASVHGHDDDGQHHHHRRGESHLGEEEAVQTLPAGADAGGAAPDEGNVVPLGYAMERFLSEQVVVSDRDEDDEDEGAGGGVSGAVGGGGNDDDDPPSSTLAAVDVMRSSPALAPAGVVLVNTSDPRSGEITGGVVLPCGSSATSSLLSDLIARDQDLLDDGRAGGETQTRDVAAATDRGEAVDAGGVRTVVSGVAADRPAAAVDIGDGVIPQVAHSSSMGVDGASDDLEVSLPSHSTATHDGGDLLAGTDLTDLGVGRVGSDLGRRSDDVADTASTTDVAPRLARLTEAEILEMANIDYASIGNVPPYSVRDEDEQLDLFPAGRGSNVFSEGTRTTVLESVSITSAGGRSSAGGRRSNLSRDGDGLLLTLSPGADSHMLDASPMGAAEDDMEGMGRQSLADNIVSTRNGDINHLRWPGLGHQEQKSAEDSDLGDTDGAERPSISREGSLRSGLSKGSNGVQNQQVGPDLLSVGAAGRRSPGSSGPSHQQDGLNLPSIPLRVDDFDYNKYDGSGDIALKDPVDDFNFETNTASAGMFSPNADDDIGTHQRKRPPNMGESHEAQTGLHTYEGEGEGSYFASSQRDEEVPPTMSAENMYHDYGTGTTEDIALNNQREMPVMTQREGRDLESLKYNGDEESRPLVGVPREVTLGNNERPAARTVGRASVASIVDSVFSSVRSVSTDDVEADMNDSEKYEASGVLARAFPERLVALLVTLAVEIPVLLMISGGSDRLCMLLGRRRYQLLMAFLPLSSAISGNCGLQSITLTTRAVSHLHVSKSSYWKWFRAEVGAACCLGLSMGAVLGLLAFQASDYDVGFGVTIFVSQFVSILFGGLTGTVAPLLCTFIFHRDSGKWGSLLETAFQDIIGTFAMVMLSYRLLLLIGPTDIRPEDVCGVVQ